MIFIILAPISCIPSISDLAYHTSCLYGILLLRPLLAKIKVTAQQAYQSSFYTNQQRMMFVNQQPPRQTGLLPNLEMSLAARPSIPPTGATILFEALTAAAIGLPHKTILSQQTQFSNAAYLACFEASLLRRGKGHGVTSWKHQEPPVNSTTICCS